MLDAPSIIQEGNFPSSALGGWGGAFPEPCSIYARANDARGEYIDTETGEIIQQMTVGEFLFSEQWKPKVQALRQMVDKYGASKAKKMEDYKRLKQSLPGATLSGLFSYRKTDHLLQHTGYLVLDIDLGDNVGLASFKNVLRVLRQRPEVAVAMRSCSGTGFFGLARIAYPEYHKQQCAALMKEYEYLGIHLDRSCSDITRIRFASWDDEPYVNVNAIPYTGVDLGTQVLAPKAAVYSTRKVNDDASDTMKKVDRLVSRIEQSHTDITADYNEWIAIGMSLASLDGDAGREYYHRVSRMNDRYRPDETEHKYKSFLVDYASRRRGIGTFFAICRQHGINL